MENYIIPLVKDRKRRGRGISSGHGKTCGRGTKGQKARKSGQVRPGFEGGQTPIYRRLPKVGFFHKKPDYEIINLSDFEETTGVESQIIDFSSSKRMVKVLGNGNLTKKVIVKTHAFSLSAKRKIESLGGEITKL